MPEVVAQNYLNLVSRASLVLGPLRSGQENVEFDHLLPPVGACSLLIV